MTNTARPVTALLATSPATAMIFLLASSVLVMSYDVYAEGATALEQMGTPDLESFATYEDMRRYFANRNLRSLRYLENPEDDSYIDAFNKHNEQPADHDLEKLKVLGMRSKRDVQQNSEPIKLEILKFDISDAVEPSDELKAIVRQHRSRELNERPINNEMNAKEPATTTQETPKQKLRTRKVIKHNRKQLVKSRTKRSIQQQPANFKVKMIPFSIDDAKEPDEATKKLIKQMRALDLEQINNKRSQSASNGRTLRTVAKTRLNRSPKLKRSRRSAKSKPEMFKFELEDAKEPESSIKKLIHDQHERKAKAFKDVKTSSNASNATQTSQSKDAKDDQESANENDSDISDDDDDDQNGHESRRFYVYKEAPKIRKSINSLPHEVQKVITQLLNEPENAKAHIKYVPTEQMDYGRLKSSPHLFKAQPPVFGTKLKAMNSAAKYETIIQKDEPMRVHSVPVVEKARHIYAGNSEQYAQKFESNKHFMHHPIVVKESGATPTKIYHSYTADLSHINSDNNNEIADVKAQAIKDVPAPQFKPSKPDPVYEQNKLAEEHVYASTISPLPIEHLKYELLSYGTAPHSYHHTYAKPHIQLLSQAHPELERYKFVAAASPTTSPPIIKIEYHAPTDATGDNYKSLAEFKELSTLMGKSPEDQIHGLTYLLAKEMQSNIVRHSKKLEADKRPQDNTSPILFHPKQQTMLHRPPNIINTQAGRLFGLGKTKEYVPIVEESAAAAMATESSKAASLHTSEAIDISPEKESPTEELYEYGTGLSANYDIVHPDKEATKMETEQLSSHHDSDSIKYPEYIGQHVAKVKLGAGLKFGEKNSPFDIHHGDHSEALQYASKYAFGYRIRDFHTGNDFGHKQNRDLDGVTRGQYHILLPDGRIQNVIYHADATGFHADVSFESGH